MLLCPSSSPGKNTGVGCLAFLQGIFPTHPRKRSNPRLLCLLNKQAGSLPLVPSGKPGDGSNKGTFPSWKRTVTLGKHMIFYSTFDHGKQYWDVRKGNLRCFLDWLTPVMDTTEDEMVGWHHRLSGHEFE